MIAATVSNLPVTVSSLPQMLMNPIEKSFRINIIILCALGKRFAILVGELMEYL